MEMESFWLSLIKPQAGRYSIVPKYSRKIEIYSKRPTVFILNILTFMSYLSYTFVKSILLPVGHHENIPT